MGIPYHLYCSLSCDVVVEMEMSASWHSEQSGFSEEKFRSLLQAVLEKLDECDYVERYAIYNTDVNWKSHMFYNEGGFTPSGQVYRDHHATFAYNSKYTKVPIWWAPSAKKPSFTMEQSSTGKLSFRINNPNGDLTERIVVERQAGGNGDWEPIGEITDRYRFDNSVQSLTNVDPTGMDLEADRFRVTVTTLLGKTVSSSSADLGFLTNPGIETDSKDEVNGWTCTRDADNGYTKAASGDTYFEVWDATASKINFDYSQTVTDLTPGIYSLSANVFNTINNVARQRCRRSLCPDLYEPLLCSCHRRHAHRLRCARPVRCSPHHLRPHHRFRQLPARRYP